VLDVKVNDFKYHRIIVDEFTDKEYNSLHTEYDYSFVISYGSFQTENYSLVNKNAVIIDLSKGMDDVFSKFNSTARKHVRRFEKIDELTFHKSVDNQSDFYKFYTECEKSRNWLPVPEDELFNSIVFYVKYNGIPISGITAYTHQNRIRMGRIFSLRNISQLENANLIFGVSAKKIVHEFCLYGIENKFETLDLGGIDLNSDQKSGISEFKLSFSDKIIPVIIGRWSKIPYDTLYNQFLEKGLDLT
jgi:lipid II:glycine glycyltransferase (peptidoglycan interpeptide bridge formation enzyme)